MFKAHRLLHRSTLGLRVVMDGGRTEESRAGWRFCADSSSSAFGLLVQGLMVEGVGTVEMKNNYFAEM